LNDAVDRERLHRLLDRPELTRLVQRLRRRFEGGGNRQGTITLAHPAPAERQAIEQLLGRPPGQGRSIQIPLQTLEHILRAAGVAPDLYRAVEVLQGPLYDRQAMAAREQAAWERVWQGVQERAAGLELIEWLDELKSTGLLKRLVQNNAERAKELLDEALRVVAVLPCQGLSLSALAANTLGDAHALDRGRPLASLVRRAVGYRGQREIEDSPEGDREVWASMGVLVGGALTSVVLFLNLPAEERTVTGRMIRLLGEAGQPGYLTLRQLVRDPPQWLGEGKTVYVCENPAVVAEAAERLGPRCAPLICTHGQAGAAVATLLRQLGKAGAKLVYHGDFDWPGIHIGNRMMEHFAVRPWRFDAHAYQTAAREGRPLTGKPVPARWDEKLMAAMLARNCQIEEEQVLDDLLEDLASHR
jgi:uncharacterized protein (TIGR02679 family)